MHYNDEITTYLEGEKFSNGLSVELLTIQEKILNRDDFLIHTSKGKNILHLGFVDHVPLLDKKIEGDNWLHQKLIKSSNLCFGIDINDEGIKYIQHKYSIDDLYTVNVVLDKIPKEILDVEFDYLLIPDVIEHIGNPVEFLEIIREKFKNNVKKVILTTPNGFRLNNFKNILKNIEVINSDHRFWFTPFTLSKIVIDAGYKIDKLGYFEHGRLSRREIFKKYILNRYHGFRDTLIIELDLE
jgi:hypothetical protein